MLIFQSVWLYFRNLSWNDVLSIVTILAAMASTVVPYLDSGQYRVGLIIFIAISVKLQALGATQENKRLRTMISDLSDSVNASTPLAVPALPAPEIKPAP